MFGLNNNAPYQAGEKKKGLFIRPGSGVVLKINDIQLEKSQNHDSKKPVFFMESAPITDEGWTGHEGAKGQIGKIAGSNGIYLKTDEQKNQFVSTLGDIAKALGVYDDVRNIEASSIEEYVDKIRPFLCGEKYARYFIRGDEFPKPNSPLGKGLKLILPTKKFVESTTVENSTLPKFDYNNKWHFNRLPAATPSDPVMGELAYSAEEPADDLPF